MKWKIGPGLIVTAAFIGPGTVTMCTISGATFGMDLLWVIALAVIGTYVLQEMSARLGIVTKLGLATLIREQVKFPFLKVMSMAIVLMAIVLGNAAYEGGNLAGASLGLQTFTASSNYGTFMLGIIAFAILWIGKYKWVEGVLIALVAVLSLTFIIAAFMAQPSISELLYGLIPKMDGEYSWNILALIGTTIVPYNLFLHSSIAQQKWKTTEDLSDQRKDSFIAIVLGGLVSACIIIVAAKVSSSYNVETIQDLAVGLEKVFGENAKYLLGIGLMAAGLTSAITAPLAAAYVVADCFGWEANLNGFRFRATWITVLLIGMLVALSGYKPVEIIRIAQVFNALLLPIVAMMIVWLSTQKPVLGKNSNHPVQLVVGIVMIGITLLMTLKVLLL